MKQNTKWKPRYEDSACTSWPESLICQQCYPLFSIDSWIVQLLVQINVQISSCWEITDALIFTIAPLVIPMPQLLTITFIEYGIGMTFLTLRILVQMSLTGFRGLRLDDAFTVAAMVCSSPWSSQWSMRVCLWKLSLGLLYTPDSLYCILEYFFPEYAQLHPLYW